MSCFIGLAAAISTTDDSLRSIYVMDVGTTASQAFALMNLQQEYSAELETDVDNAVQAGASPDAGAAAAASYWNLMYKDDSAEQQMHCGQWETMLEGAEAQIDTESSSRETNFGMAQGIPNTLGALNTLLTQFFNK